MLDQNFFAIIYCRLEESALSRAHGGSSVVSGLLVTQPIVRCLVSHEFFMEFVQNLNES